MNQHLLTTTSPIALERRKQESGRIALMHFCKDAITHIATQELAEKRLEDFAVVCVDLMPLFQDDLQEAHANSDPLSTASCVPHPAAVFAASDDTYTELVQTYPEQAHVLMRTIPGMLKVIVVDDYGVTVCFTDLEEHAATRH